MVQHQPVRPANMQHTAPTNQLPAAVLYHPPRFIWQRMEVLSSTWCIILSSCRWEIFSCRGFSLLGFIMCRSGACSLSDHNTPYLWQFRLPCVLTTSVALQYDMTYIRHYLGIASNEVGSAQSLLCMCIFVVQLEFKFRPRGEAAAVQRKCTFSYR